MVVRDGAGVFDLVALEGQGSSDGWRQRGGRGGLLWLGGSRQLGFFFRLGGWGRLFWRFRGDRRLCFTLCLVRFRRGLDRGLYRVFLVFHERRHLSWAFSLSFGLSLVLKALLQEWGQFVGVKIALSHLHGQGLGLGFVTGDELIDQLLFVAFGFREQAP
jgi:hypothetical protein